MQESKLIERAKQGDSQAFAKLYDLYIRQIYDFIYYKTHHKPTAEDLTADTFLRALQKIDQFEAGRSFKPWLYRIAQNIVIDHYRKSSRETVVEDIWDIPEDKDALLDSETRDHVRELKGHLKNLPSVQRDILTLRLWQGLSYREIAEIVGKEEANCKVIYSRTLKALQSEMAGAALLLLLIHL